MMLINTKVSRNTKTLVSKVGDFVRNYPSIANHILEATHEVSKTALDYIELLNDSTARDDQKAIAFEKLGDLAEINHGLLSVLGVSHPSLENIISILKNYGLKGKLTGAGGGGYAICLIPSHFTDIKVDEVLLDIRNHGYDAKITVLGDEGVRVDA
ncbi:hypothetical protein WA026_002529 [Henosepilachna vigintioctopunctata]|uniref:GHMP kinase C-terminal domain-containing protein n=1 Tax=Henosepilachna vigintioctopunctata TaxID=420089 RepID=A0AAW1U0M8_9CUCU